MSGTWSLSAASPRRKIVRAGGPIYTLTLTNAGPGTVRVDQTGDQVEPGQSFTLMSTGDSDIVLVKGKTAKGVHMVSI